MAETIEFNLPDEIFQALSEVRGTSFNPRHLNALQEAKRIMWEKYPQLEDPKEGLKLAQTLLDTPNIMDTVEGRVKLLVTEGLWLGKP